MLHECLRIGGSSRSHRERGRTGATGGERGLRLGGSSRSHREWERTGTNGGRFGRSPKLRVSVFKNKLNGILICLALVDTKNRGTGAEDYKAATIGMFSNGDVKGVFTLAPHLAE